MRGKRTADREFNKQIDLIDDAIRGAPRLPVGMALFRGFKVDSTKRRNRKFVGEVGDPPFDWRTYISTSTSEKIAKNWSRGHREAPDEIVYKIVAKPGTQLRALNLNISGNGNNYESEFLMPRGTRFKVISKKVSEVKMRGGIVDHLKFAIVLQAQD